MGKWVEKEIKREEKKSKRRKINGRERLIHIARDNERLISKLDSKVQLLSGKIQRKYTHR